MPTLSTLRTAAAAGVRSALTTSSKCQHVTVPVRRMGGHSMQIRPSEYQKYRVKDNIIYFTALGVVPLAIITTYANIRIGPAQLADTPEGYVPEPHEYFKSPISRFFAKHLITCPEKMHERTLYFLYKADQKRHAKILEKKVKHLTEMKMDTKGWYYVPMTGTVEERKEAKERSSFARPRV